MAILEKIRNYLVEDCSGAVTVEWTALTAALTIAAVSTMGTFGVGVHAVAFAIEQDVVIPSDAEIAADAASGEIGGTANTLAL